MSQQQLVVVRIGRKDFERRFGSRTFPEGDINVEHTFEAYITGLTEELRAYFADHPSTKWTVDTPDYTPQHIEDRVAVTGIGMDWVVRSDVEWLIEAFEERGTFFRYNLKKFVTTAPQNYDGFGTQTLVEDAGRWDGRPIRAVGIVPSAQTWQLDRYASGLELYESAETFLRQQVWNSATFLNARAIYTLDESLVGPL